MFLYPESDSHFLTVLNKQQVHAKLRNQRDSLKITKQYFTIIEVPQKYIYVRCRLCNAHIKYKFSNQQSRYKLVNFHNKHQHSNSRENYFQSYLSSFPLSASLVSIRDIATQQLSISQSQFYYYWTKFNSKVASFSDLIKNFEQLNYINSSQFIPDIFITCSREMREDFKSFGFCISFDLTYGVIRQVKEGRKYGFGMILGRNENLKPIPFAVVAMNTETTEAMASLMSSFFEIIGGKPETIVTDMQPSIKSALEYLVQSDEWSGCHVWDSYHYIRSLSKKLKQQQQILALLKQAMYVEQQFDYEMNLNKAIRISKTLRVQKIIEQFQKTSNMTCISRIKTKRWLNLSSSYHQQSHNFLKKYLHYQKPLVKTLQKSMDIMEKLKQKSKLARIQKIEYEKMVQSIALRQIRKNVDHKVFHVLLKRFIKSLKLEYKEVRNDYFEFDHDIVKRVSKGEEVILQCTCNILNSQGLPCAHLIRICEDFKQSIQKYISKRWHLLQQNLHKEIKYYFKGRPRKSRRNRQK